MTGDIAESRSFHRTCLLMAVAISVIFAVRYGWMIYTGVYGAIFAHDFEVFYRAAWAFVQSPSASPYGTSPPPTADDDNTIIHYHPFLNPPFLLYIIWPLGLMPYRMAMMVYLLAQIALWMAVLASPPVRRLFPGLAKAPGGYMLSAAALSLPFITNTVLTGQLGIFYAAIMLLGTSLLFNRPRTAGAILGLMALKPTLGILVPFMLLAGRQWRALFAFGAMGLALCASVFILWPPSIWAQWHDALGLHIQMLEQPHLPEKYRIQLISLYAAVRMIGLSATPALLVQTMGCIVIAGLLMRMAFMHKNDPRLLPFLFTGSFLVTAYTLQYDAVLVSAALLYLLNVNSIHPLAPSTRIGLLLGISFSLLTIQAQMFHIPFGAITLTWLSWRIYREKPAI